MARRPASSPLLVAVCACVCIPAYVYLRVCACVCVPACVYLRVCACVFVALRACVPLCVCPCCGGMLGLHSYFVELVDADLLSWTFTIRDALNAKYNKTHGTLAAKHSDVPGMSRSAIPVLAAAGVQALHIGYNSGSMKPAGLPPVFVWEHPETQTEIVMLVESGACRACAAVCTAGPKPGGGGGDRRDTLVHLGCRTDLVTWVTGRSVKPHCHHR
jgi:hypothetical protein